MARYLLSIDNVELLVNCSSGCSVQPFHRRERAMAGGDVYQERRGPLLETERSKRHHRRRETEDPPGSAHHQHTERASFADRHATGCANF